MQRTLCTKIIAALQLGGAARAVCGDDVVAEALQKRLANSNHPALSKPVAPLNALTRGIAVQLTAEIRPCAQQLAMMKGMKSIIEMVKGDPAKFWGMPPDEVFAVVADAVKTAASEARRARLHDSLPDPTDKEAWAGVQAQTCEEFQVIALDVANQLVEHFQKQDEHLQTFLDCFHSRVRKQWHIPFCKPNLPVEELKQRAAQYRCIRCVASDDGETGESTTDCSTPCSSVDSDSQHSEDVRLDSPPSSLRSPFAVSHLPSIPTPRRLARLSTAHDLPGHITADGTDRNGSDISSHVKYFRLDSPPRAQAGSCLRNPCGMSF